MAKVQKIGKGGRCRIRGAHHERTGKYVRQRVRTEANKIRKRLKHCKKHPNDQIAQKLLT